MGDDYDNLCEDMLQDIADVLNPEGKASKKVREIARLFAGWKAREVALNKYRKQRAS